MAISEQDVTMVLMHQGYPLADGGTASFVVGMKDCLNEKMQMNATDTSVGGWDACNCRTRLANEVYPAIPDKIRGLFKLMNIWTANGGKGAVGVYSEDYLALSAEKEVIGNSNTEIEEQLPQFKWYETAANRIKKGVGGEVTPWWLRSPSPYLYSEQFTHIWTSGNAGAYNADTYESISPFGCI